MSRYIRLSEELLRYHQLLHQDRSYYDAPVRLGAGRLAVTLHGQEALQRPYLLNGAALALAQERLTVHRLDNASIAQVRQTEVRTLPSEPPRLLQSGWILETADLRQPLFADVVCLGGYTIEGEGYLLAMRYPDGISVGAWTPRWGDSDVEGSFVEESLPWFISDQGLQRELTLEGIEFALTLGALLDAEGTPLDSRPERVVSGIPKRKPAPRNPNPLAWSVRHIRLNNRAAVPAMPAQSAETTPGETAARDGLRAEKRPIRGFLRRQPYGPGRTERKWVYIAGFEATRYVGDKPLRVAVKGDADAL